MLNQALKPWQIGLALLLVGAGIYVMWPVFPCGRTRTPEERQQELARVYFAKEIGKLVAAGKPKGEITLPDQPDAGGSETGMAVRQFFGKEQVGYTVHEHKGMHMYIVFDLQKGRALSSGRYSRWYLEEAQENRKSTND